MENSNEIAQQDIGLKHAVFPGKRAKPIRQSMLAAAVHRPHGLLVARDRLRAIHSPTPTATMVSTEPSTPIMESCSLDGAIQKNKPRHESRRCHGEKKELSSPDVAVVFILLTQRMIIFRTIIRQQFRMENLDEISEHDIRLHHPVLPEL